MPVFRILCFLHIFLLFVVISCNKVPEYAGTTMLGPEPIGDDEGKLQEMRSKWIALSHRAAPEVNWRSVEESNAELMRTRKKSLLKGGLGQQEYFAGGILQGIWEEKGSLNQAGSIIGIDFDAPTENLYAISAGGTLWRNNGLSANNWTLLNDDYQFYAKILKVINKAGGGRRLLVAYNKQILYSDNEGASFIKATGINYPVTWGGNEIMQLEAIKGEANNLFALVYFWDNVSWSPRLGIFRSTDDGNSFTRIYTFNHGDAGRLKMTAPHNSENLYVFDAVSNNGKWTTWQVNGNTVTTAGSITAPEIFDRGAMRGTLVSNTHYLYLLANNKKVYSSDNLGAAWTLQSTLPEDAWERIEVAIDDPAKVFYGGVHAFRSYTSATTWTRLNSWPEYYNNIDSKLHADIMEIRQFRRSDGNLFTIVNSHGGVAISFDQLTSTNNISVTGLMSAQYYDVLTPPRQESFQYIYTGSQDQGFQKTSSANNLGPQSFRQIISGDYGYLTFASNSQVLHAQYPGGSIYSFTHPASNYIKNWTMPGTFKPNYGWMLPMENYYQEDWDTVLMAGGNITGGGGSYLVKMAMQPASPNNTFVTQYDFDFRAASTSGKAGITAIEAPVTQRNKLYVALEDGSFFYSNDYGQHWTKTENFNGATPWYLYGSTIVASKLTPNLVWYGGSGYSNPAVYVSTNGGQSFTPMNSGLPNTLVHEIVANLSETMLFAATEAGPYVYVVQQGKWFPMIGANTPIQNYTSVEYLPFSNTVRFSTYGRGIWDFSIQSPALYIFTGNGYWNNSVNWNKNLVPPSTLPAGDVVWINPDGNGLCTLNTLQTLASGAMLLVAPGKRALLNGNLQLQ